MYISVTLAVLIGDFMYQVCVPHVSGGLFKTYAIKKNSVAILSRSNHRMTGLLFSRQWLIVRYSS